MVVVSINPHSMMVTTKRISIFLTRMMMMMMMKMTKVLIFGIKGETFFKKMVLLRERLELLYRRMTMTRRRRKRRRMTTING